MNLEARMPDIQDKTPLIEADGLNKNYGGVRALIDAKFSCARGEVHALLGENGAGKSTLIKILCGVVKPDSGRIRMQGKEVEINSPMDAVRHGIVAVFQELSLVPDLSVAENIYLGHEPKNKFGLIDFKKTNEMAHELLNELGFEIDSKALVRDLPLAQKQLVEISKALSRNPQLIIFDEATSALGQHEVNQLFTLIKRLTKQEKTVVFISHRMNELHQIADRATIFRDTRYITTFDWGTVGNEQIVNWIAGRDLNETFSKRKKMETKEIALDIRNLSSGRRLRNINLQVRKGEILGIAGLQGHGQSDFLRALFGAYPVEQGEIKLYGRDVSLKSPEAAIKQGIALVPEERKTDGLLLTRSVRENLALMTLDRRQTAGLINTKEEDSAVDQTVAMLNIKTHDLNQEVGNLSGGNQQKVVIGKAILTHAKVLLLADPTRGIDVGTKAEIYQLMNKLTEEGMTILFYSTELAELIHVCHRVAVFKQGQIVAILEEEEVNELNIINAALSMS
ncbi:sugar ABC transporter ATP-binding protein [Ferviditalea candida]|uniref:Sugar ABC transporter ATP-binding protein n=1 Tax=Ferviditalea candida TaxID=3108399 RepID=A0ABU5ZMQ2_9BACL|nr:sugar ABC transporter ATP-binding protein [Paenibacillaceae bacterium T2]